MQVLKHCRTDKCYRWQRAGSPCRFQQAQSPDIGLLCSYLSELQERVDSLERSLRDVNARLDNAGVPAVPNGVENGFVLQEAHDNGDPGTATDVMGAWFADETDSRYFGRAFKWI